VTSPTLAAGLPSIRKVGSPVVMISPWAVLSPTLAAGLPLVGIVNLPAALVSSGKPALVVRLSLRAAGFDMARNG